MSLRERFGRVFASPRSDAQITAAEARKERLIEEAIAAVRRADRALRELRLYLGRRLG